MHSERNPRNVGVRGKFVMTVLKIYFRVSLALSLFWAGVGALITYLV